MIREKEKITFADVAGCDEAKDEVREVVEFLKDPQRYQLLGGRIPKGVLLVGAPERGNPFGACGGRRGAGTVL
jgi:cell division protease FtsH